MKSVACCILLLLLCAFGAYRWATCNRRRVGYASPESRWLPPTIVSNVLTRDECAKLIDYAEASHLLNPSTVLNDKQTVDQRARVSETAWIPRTHPISLKLRTIAARLANKSIDCCEDMQLVKYQVGGYYRAHHDACCDDTKICDDFQARGGQRVGTLLVYLNDAFTDGETHFPSYKDARLKVPPGDAIFFHPLEATDGKCHPHALHAGLPISSGVKYICNIWVRERTFV